MQITTSSQPRQPFFARLLEAQQDDGSAEILRPPVHTLRYPSDDDEF